MNLAFVGDITPGGLFVRQGGVSDEVLQFLSSFDLRVGTLESAMGNGGTLCHIKTSDPTLCTIIYSPDESVKLLKEMHINAVSLANNHVCDCDLDGLYHTIDLLDENGIAHFGAGRNATEAEKPAVLRVGDKTVCLLGYLREYQYLYRGEGYHPTDTTGGVNIYQIDKALRDIEVYKNQYDYVFVMPHWGREGSAVPKVAELKDARMMIEAGASGVIGSHTHVVQPVVSYKKGLIAMSLGNFAFPDRYVIPPRISYYPSDTEIAAQSIPTVKAFECVESLTLKVVDETERKGAILSVSIAGTKIDYSLRTTYLDSRNNVVFRTLSFREKFFAILNRLAATDRYGVLYKLYSKLFAR